MEKLNVQALDARKQILGVEHPHTILAMKHLAATLRSVGKYTVRGREAGHPKKGRKSRIPGAECHYTVATVPSIQDVQETQVLNVRSTAVEEYLQ